MARTDMGVWIPEERGSDVLRVVEQTSAVEALARPEPMTSETKTIPRSGGVDVAVTPKGSAYAENDNVDDEVVLTSRKFTGLLRIAEEDLGNIPENIVAGKQREWASNYSVALDHACLGTVGAVSQPTRPFESVYQNLATTQAGLGYTALANIVRTAGAINYDDFSDVLGRVEMGSYFGGDLVVMAHPYFRGALRGIKDTAGNPVFIQGLAGTPDTLFGYQVRWTQGAALATAFSATPAVVTGGGAAAAAGNPILVVAARNALVLGKHSGPEFAAISGWNGVGALTDEAIVKARSQRGFALLHPKAAAILEVSNA